LKDAEIEAEEEITHECKPKDQREPEWKPDPDFDAEDDYDEKFELEDDGEPEAESRTETKDRNGKPIKSARYMKTFYGFRSEPCVKCRCCGESIPLTMKGEEQASAFNELV
jgi:hypothetical protein